MIDQTTVRGRIIAAAMALAAEKPWGSVALGEIAARADLSLLDLKREFSGKSAIVAAFMDAVDDEMLHRVPRDVMAQAPRDALFEVVMSRLDVLQPYREAVRSIMRDIGPDPLLLRRVLTAQGWMLAAAGVPTDGMAGAVRLAGLASVYASVMRTWLNDDDPGLARTMAALDRRLRSGERTLSTIDGIFGNIRDFGERMRRRPSRDAGASSTPPPPPRDEPPSPSI